MEKGLFGGICPCNRPFCSPHITACSCPIHLSPQSACTQKSRVVLGASSQIYIAWALRLTRSLVLILLLFLFPLVSAGQADQAAG